MDYEEASEYIVTREEARREIKLHLLSFEDFLREAGDKKEYLGHEILDWLGY